MNSTPVVLERGMLPVTAPDTDRLPPMLFLAALFHALVILGVTFDIGLPEATDTSLTLDVVVLSDTNQRIVRPDEAAYLAAVSQTGAGSTSDRTPAGAPPPGVSAPGELTEMLGDIAPDVDPAEFDLAAAISSTDPAARSQALNDRPPEPEDSPSNPSSPPTGVEQSLPLPEREWQQPELYDPDPRELVFSVDTRESELATYLAAWKRQVETAGTRFYNREQLASFADSGSPIIEVKIDLEGSLTEIVVVRSSGNGSVDQAALNVLRQASPYPPIPGHLKDDYDSLRFRYRFEFARVY
ncbi:MAG: energy transducer TonB [Pseudomonadota bacterium]